MSSEAVRIKLLERDDVTPEAAALYDALLAQRGVVPNMFKAPLIRRILRKAWPDFEAVAERWRVAGVV